MHATIASKVMRNTACNILGRAWSVLVALALTPYIIGKIGLEGYGIWALVSVVTGYFGLLDFGIGSSFVKYIAEFSARAQHGKIASLINTGLIFYSVLGLLLVAVAALCMPWLLSLLKIPAAFHQEASFVVFIGIVLFAGSNALSPFAALQSGMQRMDIVNTISFAVSIPSALGTVYFLEQGLGLRGLMVNNALVFVLTALINGVIAFKLLPGLRISLLAFDREMFARLFAFGYRVQITRISSIVVSQTDKLLIVYFLSLGLVAFYQLGSSMLYYAMSACGLLVSALMPAFTEIDAKEGRQALSDSYLRSVKYVSAAAVPLFMFLALASAKLIFIWMGLGYAHAVPVIRILCLGFLINAIAQVSSGVCMAIDRIQLMSAASVLIVFLNIVLSVVLVKLFGFFGIAWGSALAVNIGTVYFLYRLHGFLGIPLRSFFKPVVIYLLPAAAAAALAWGVDAVFLLSAGKTVTRGLALVSLCVQAAVFGLAYAGIIYRARLFDRRDVEFVRQKLPLLLPNRYFSRGGKNGPVSDLRR